MNGYWYWWCSLDHVLYWNMKQVAIELSSIIILDKYKGTLVFHQWCHPQLNLSDLSLLHHHLCFRSDLDQTGVGEYSEHTLQIEVLELNTAVRHLLSLYFQHMGFARLQILCIYFQQPWINQFLARNIYTVDQNSLIHQFLEWFQLYLYFSLRALVQWKLFIELIRESNQKRRRSIQFTDSRHFILVKQSFDLRLSDVQWNSDMAETVDLDLHIVYWNIKLTFMNVLSSLDW